MYTPPSPRIIPLMEEQDIQDKYPSEDVKKIMQNRALASQYKRVVDRFRYCSKGIPIEGPGDPGDGSVTQPPGNWSNTCPSYTRYYYIPKKVWFPIVKQYCWVLPPWRETFCSYATCVNPVCQYVKAEADGAEGPSPPPSTIRCVQSHWERIYYYIICPNPWHIYLRLLGLPRSCSCEQFTCGN